MYLITTYHHGTQFGPGTILSTLLTDGLVTDQVISTNFLGSAGTGPSAIATESFHFNVVGGSPVLIEFIGGNGGNHMQLNGFDLQHVPEPSTVAMLLGLGSIGLLAWMKRRRKS